MKKRFKLLFALLIAIMLIAAILYIIGKLGLIDETVMMLVLLPLMLGSLSLICIIYVEYSSDEKRNR